MDDLLAEFLTETAEGLAALDTALVRLERTPDDGPTLGEIFRMVHTIKGTCGFLGLTRLERVAHAAESVLVRYRDGDLAVTPAGVTLVLSALDRLKEIVAGIAAGGAEVAGDDGTLVAALDALAEGATPAGAPAPSPGRPAASAASEAPAPAEAPGAPAGPPEPPAAPDAPAGAPADGATAPPRTIRVAVDVLENLMTLVGELVLTRNQLLRLARAQGDAALTTPVQRLGHITAELQAGVMRTRMQPIGHAWNQLPRLVRDLSQDLGKPVALEMRGAETELDRQVLELIRDPLTHMVRNSVDHGLEDAAGRRAAGKPECGRILLEARHEGGHVVVEVGDDGRGLALARIRAKAVAQGLAGEAEVAAMDEAAVRRFIFHAGFSTAAAVTAVSGRGVGMDVVRTNVERIGGTIEVASREGRGTTFTIRIPLTLAIVPALVVEAGGERFAIPQTGVVELVRVGEGAARIERIGEAGLLRLRERLLPLVSLSRLLRLDGAPDASPDAAGFVVVTQVGHDAFGILVDRVFDTEEIVVKPVAPILRHVTLFGGNTILGDGAVIMILDPNGIARAAGVAAGRAAERTRPPAQATMRSDGATALLLFSAGDGAPGAVPLGLVARLEEVPAERIEFAAGLPVLQYRGRLMPLLPVTDGWVRGPAGTRQAVLVFGDRDRAMGLMVDAILDVTEEALRIERGSERPGWLGTAVIAGRATEVLDSGWWLRRAVGDWFSDGAASAARRLLLVEDSAFFRHLVVPGLAAAGFEVTAVGDGAEALRLRQAGAAFEAIVSDIEMPEVDGLALARAVRAGGAWAALPMVALSSRVEPESVRRGREAGFDEYVGKYDAEALLAALRRCLGTPGPGAPDAGVPVRDAPAPGAAVAG